jgi:hypothetical protein
MDTDGPVSIGDLAEATSSKVVTIRYYERIGLLPSPPRTPGNYRVSMMGSRFYGSASYAGAVTLVLRSTRFETC